MGKCIAAGRAGAAEMPLFLLPEDREILQKKWVR